MTPVYLDFETYWSTTHTLSRMSPTEYVMSPLTEIISLAIRVGDNPTEVVFGEDEIASKLAEVDWSDAMAIGHNMSGFDSMILAWRFNVYPKMWGCTAAMARSKYSKTEAIVDGKKMVGVSLKKLSVELGVGKKLDLEATNTKGKYLADFTPYELELMREYNKVDTDLCAELFKVLVKATPKAELLQIHMTTQMLVAPKFVADTDLLNNTLIAVQADKEAALEELAQMLNVQTNEEVRAMMASAARFGQLLKDRGVDVPMKPSPTDPNKQTPALAKTDEAFIKLQEHEDKVVAAAARTRLEVKSTILETRIEAFLAASQACGGKLPVPLKYCGADTTGRWSGEQYNMQNLPRIGAKPKLSDALRMSVRAPKGHMVVVADLSGIELRVNMFLWKVTYAMALFKASPDKADLYKYFAANDLYNITEAEVTKEQRQVGKVAHLGLGFGAGAATFQKVAKLMGGVSMELEESNRVVTTYRSAHKEIAQGWRTFQDSLSDIKQGVSRAIDPWGMCEIEHEAIRLPSGRRIHYPDLHRRNENGKTEWWYGNGRTSARIYAGKGVENMVQALARDVIADNAIAVRRASGLEPSLMVHDELVYVVPDTDAQAVLDLVQTTMRTPPKWWPELVTWSEGDIAACYGEAK